MFLARQQDANLVNRTARRCRCGRRFEDDTAYYRHQTPIRLPQPAEYTELIGSVLDWHQQLQGRIVAAFDGD